MKSQKVRKIISIISSCSLVFQTFLPLTIALPVYADEATDSAIVEATPTPEITPEATPTLEPTPETTITPEITPEPTPSISLTPTVEVTPEPIATPEITPETTPTEQPAQEEVQNNSPPAEQNNSQSEVPVVTSLPEQITQIAQLEQVITPEITPTLTTDKADYFPTDTVYITGVNFLPNTVYTLKITSNDYPVFIITPSVTSDENGNLTYSFRLDGNYRPNYAIAALDENGEIVTSYDFTDTATVTTPATGGSSISADTTNGTYTLLTGPVLTEGAYRDINTGTIILNAPSGFIFDTGSTVTVNVSRIAGSQSQVILHSNTAIVTSTTISITVDSRDGSGGSNNTRSELTWSGIKVRPTSGTLPSTGNITNSGSATISGITSSTIFGTLTEVTGAVNASTSTVSVSLPSIPADNTTTSTITVTLKDQFGNPVSGKAVSLAKTSGSGTPTISAPSGTSNSSGVVTFTVKSTTVGTNVFTATDTTDSRVIAQTASVTFTGSITLTPANGGSSIFSSTVGGTYTSLSGPTLQEENNGTIGAGTIVLNAPSGFEFDSGSVVTATVLNRPGGDGTNLTLSSGTATVTATSITTTVINPDQVGTTRSILFWSGIKVRPTSASPLASGNITNSGTAIISGISGSTNFGTLTEVDNARPTASITYSKNSVKTGDSLTITATFNEPMANSPIPMIAISGSNTVAATNMTKTDTTHYSYTYTVGAGEGTATVSLSNGTDLSGLVVVSTPTSGATFTVDNIAPSCPSPTISTSASGTYVNGNTIYYSTNITAPGTFTVSEAPVDGGSGIQKVNFSAIGGYTGGGDDTVSSYEKTYTWYSTSNDANGNVVTCYDNAGNSATNSFNAIKDINLPVVNSIVLDKYFVKDGATINISSSITETGSGIASCHAYWTSSNVFPMTSYTDLGDLGTDCSGSVTVPAGAGTYYIIIGSTLGLGDNVGNFQTAGLASSVVLVDNTPPSTSDDTGFGGQTYLVSKTFTLTPTDAGSGIADTKYCVADSTSTCTPDTSGTSVTVTCAGTSCTKWIFYQSTDRAGNVEADGMHSYSFNIVNDSTPPVITKVITGSLGTNSWYTSDVSVTWTVTDDESTAVIDSGCGTQDFTDETTGVTSSCYANSLGGSSSDSVDLMIDKTGPLSSLVVTAGILGLNGWYKSDVTVATSCFDLISAITSYSSDQYQTENTSGQEFNGWCTNWAGLSTNASPLTIKLDKTIPTVTSVDSDGDVYNRATVSPHAIKVTFSEDISNTPTISINPTPLEPQTVNNCSDADAKTFCFNYAIPVGQEITHTIHILNAQDAAGNSMTEDVGHTFEVDTITPTATVAYDISTQTNTDVVATITPSETVTGDLTHTFTANGSFTFNFTDLAGNPGSVVATVNNIDKDLPTVTSVDSDGDIYTIATGATHTIKVTMSETIANVPLIDVYSIVGNQSVNNCGDDDDTTFCFNYPIVLGEETSHTIHISNAQDSAGNISTLDDNHTFYVDTIAPTATISFDITTPTNTDVVATIHPSEPLSVTNNSGSFNYTFTANGNFTFNLQDMYGNTGTAQTFVDYIDKISPSTSADAGTYTFGNWTTDNIYASLSCTDGESGCHNTYWCYDDGIVACTPGSVGSFNGGTYSSPLLFNAEGHWYLRFNSDDNAGNIESAQVQEILIDKTSPTASISYDITTITNTDVVATLTTDGEPITITNNGGVSTYTFSANGTFTFEFVDAAGNTGSETASVDYIDKTAPTVTYEDPTPTNGLQTNNNDQTFKVSLNEDVSSCSLNFGLNNGGFEEGNLSNWSTSGNANWFVDNTFNKEGSLSARSGNMLGWNDVSSTLQRSITTGANSMLTFWWMVKSESGWDFLSFYLDGVGQNGISGDTNWQQMQYNLGSGVHNLQWTYSKDSSVTRYPYDAGYLDDVRVSGATGDSQAMTVDNANHTATITLNDMADSNYSYSIHCNDLAGNLGYENTRTLTIDTVAPSINAGSDRIVTSAFDQDGTVSDATSGIDSIEWSQISGPGTITFGSPNNEDTHVSVSEDGVYVARLTASDNGGNSSYDEFEFTQDSTNPVITIIGDNPLIVDLNSTFVDPGATANDNIDGDISANIIVSGDTVDTTILGDYSVLYDVSDSIGHEANQMERIVRVEDIPEPVVSNDNPQSVGSSIGSNTPPSCNDTKPGSAPTLISAIAGTNSVTLNWSAATNPVSYYLITYGNQSGAQQYGNPNVGGSGTTSYTINGLSGGNTYYFKVRAGNGCMPGDFSNEVSATPGGIYIETPAEGFEQGVMGASTEATPSATPTTETNKGILGTSSNNNSNLWWFLILIPLFFGGRIIFKKK